MPTWTAGPLVLQLADALHACRPRTVQDLAVASQFQIATADQRLFR